MRRIIAALQLSVDGFIEAPNGNTDDNKPQDPVSSWRSALCTRGNE